MMIIHVIPTFEKKTKKYIKISNWNLLKCANVSHLFTDSLPITRDKSFSPLQKLVSNEAICLESRILDSSITRSYVIYFLTLYVGLRKRRYMFFIYILGLVDKYFFIIIFFRTIFFKFLNYHHNKIFISIFIRLLENPYKYISQLYSLLFSSTDEYNIGFQ